MEKDKKITQEALDLIKTLEESTEKFRQLNLERREIMKKFQDVLYRMSYCSDYEKNKF